MLVLVAEEKPRIARFLQRSLQREGYAVELASNGEQALAPAGVPAFAATAYGQ